MTLKYVLKRNGKQVLFDSTKIENAVLKAARAVNSDNKNIGKEVTEEVISYLNIFFKDEGIPQVEQIQDLVEKVLIEKGYADIAKAYILYREQHNKIRDTRRIFDDALNSMGNYLDRSDWKVNENSNMGYSLQGLNNFISSEVTAQYWLQEIYPSEVRKKHIEGDFHIHDLGNLSVYCCGWDLEDFLLTGFKGVPTKIESKPPRHLKSAMGQIVNFFFTLQGESAGAQAFSNFDTYLAPFIAYDNLDYEEVKQAIQEFLFNVNVPTRVGFQCLSEDTEILTPDGWKKYSEIEKGDTIKTFNTDKAIIENKKIKKIFRRHYNGKMFNIKNRIQDQLISPGHRMVRRKFNTDNYCLDEVENVNKLKSPPIIPIAADNDNDDIDLTDEEIKLIAWIITEGSLETKGNWRRITIYQSKKKSPETYEEIIALLKILDLDYSVQEGAESLGETVSQIRFNADTSRKLLKWFDKGDDIKHVPVKLHEMSQEQSKLFLETYIKGDGHEECKITTSDKGILESLQHIIVNSGYGFTVWTRKATGVGNKLLYILRVIRHKDTYIQEIKEVDYKGVIWSVNTENETVIAKRNDKVFITGNTPFTNITMDLKVPDYLADQPVIIGGKHRDHSYGEFQEEMNLLNRAFAEVMIAGDAKHRTFSFPIPTYNITKDFDWDDPVLDPVWEMTAKFGIPYFCLNENTTIITNNGTKKIKNIDIKNDKVLGKDGEFHTISRYKKNIHSEYIKIKTANNQVIESSKNHKFPTQNGLKRAVNLSINDKLLEYNKKIIFENGFKLSYKNQAWFDIYNKNNQQVRFEDIKNHNIDDFYCLKLKERKLKEFGNDHRQYKDKTEFRVKETGDGIYLFVNNLVERINYVSITGLNKVKKRINTVDITVDSDNHLFTLENGIVTHNSNFVNSDMSPEDARSMCCRLRLDNKELRKRGGGLFGSNPMTGSIGVVTLNMPRIGYLANNKHDFLNRTYELMDFARESLEIKRKILENFTEQGLYPYAKFYLRNIKKRFDEYWKNHFNTIGLNGMNEALLNFMNKDISTPEGQNFAVKVMKKMQERLVKYQEETNNMYNLEATPAEGTSYRLARLDKEKFANKIIAANEDKVRSDGANPYYTNSTHLPVGFTNDIFTALDLQDNLQQIYTGGTVFHGFLGEKMPDIESTKLLVKRIAENYRLPYYTITPTFSICPVHGYLAGAHEYCPLCAAEDDYNEN